MSIVILALDPLLSRKGALLWLYTENKALDGLTPAEVVENGQSERIMDLIEDSLNIDLPYY